MNPFVILFFAFLNISLPTPAEQPFPSAILAPQNLRCEYLPDPMAVDALPPRFCWIPVHMARGAAQSAFQILVSRNPEISTGETWDSGKVESPDFTHVSFGGRALESGATYFWKVRIWDDAGNASPWSQSASFGIGLLNKSDWKGKWIAGGALMRREFLAPARIVRAKAFIAAAGYYELRINGRKIGDHVLDPAYTPYAKRILYETYDVTGSLQQGANAVGIMLGEGWYGNRVALLQLNIDLEGGKRLEVITDESWQTGPSPILSDSIYHGETYDARLEQTGWDQPGFQSFAWKPVTTKAAPTQQLSAQMMPPIRIIQDIPPFKMTQPKPGVFVYDMGQNFSGWVRLKVKGARGTTVRLRHAELLYEDGMLNVENLRDARATDTYTLKGEGPETYEPRFTYHGFRYVEVTGYPGIPTMDAILGRVVHTDVKAHGGFSCSKPLFNQIQRLVQWGITSNLHSIPTDCNQRDERMGWMADAHLYAESAMLNFDMAAFYTVWLRSIQDEQAEDGAVPDTTPRARFATGPADPAWGSAYPLLLWYMWQQYGDKRILEQHFEGIRKWSDFCWGRSENGILNFFKFGDWVPVEKTPGNLVSTSYSYWSADLVSRIAEVLGRIPEQQMYRQRAEEIKKAFHANFYHPAEGTYGNGSQTSNLLPLYLDLVPRDLRGRVHGNLIHDLTYKWNSHLSTGILGTKYALPYLMRSGAADLAYDIAAKTDYPGWGYMIENGATTLWELWQKREGPSMNSHNHPMFGSIGAWFYRELAGLSMPEGEAGYAKLRIRPFAIRDLRYASAGFDTIRGPVQCLWRREDDLFAMDVVIPFGASAAIEIPKLRLRDVTLTEGGNVLWKGTASQATVKGIQAIRETDAAVIVQVGSGSYHFELRSR